jgi:hypothetical protein
MTSRTTREARDEQEMGVYAEQDRIEPHPVGSERNQHGSGKRCANPTSCLEVDAGSP